MNVSPFSPNYEKKCIVCGTPIFFWHKRSIRKRCENCKTKGLLRGNPINRDYVRGYTAAKRFYLHLEKRVTRLEEQAKQCNELTHKARLIQIEEIKNDG